MLIKNAAILSAGACLALATPPAEEPAANEQTVGPVLTIRPDLSQDVSTHETLELREDDGETHLALGGTLRVQWDDERLDAARVGAVHPLYTEFVLSSNEAADTHAAPTLEPRIARSPFSARTLEYTPGASVIYGGPGNPRTLAWTAPSYRGPALELETDAVSRGNGAGSEAIWGPPPPSR